METHTVMLPTDDLRILAFHELSAPADVICEFPRTARAADTVASARLATHRILNGDDDRLILVIGPCSVHDPGAALEYAQRLKSVRDRLSGQLEIIMRVYFEKPRTTVGWKGLINDPGLDGTFDIDRGLRIARRLLRDIADLGVPAGCEFLDTTTPQYIADLVAWAAIGARTTESQVHREMASGLSCPVGFKNSTDGNVAIAVDAVLSASHPHHFMAITKAGRSAIAATAGNPDCHIILRGGKTPNYDAANVEAASVLAARIGLKVAIMIDASHANSGKRAENQPLVVEDVSRQIGAGDGRIVGMMVESNLVAGRQDQIPGTALVHGCSITDACIDWEMSIAVMDRLAQAVEDRRCHRPIPDMLARGRSLATQNFAVTKRTQPGRAHT
jgi:3-deoxy-7-phosphoheptulonate synthase